MSASKINPLPTLIDLLKQALYALMLMLAGIGAEYTEQTNGFLSNILRTFGLIH